MTIATIIPSLTSTPPSRANPVAFPTDGDSFLNDLAGIVFAQNTVASELTAWNSEIETFKNQSAASETNAESSENTALTQARNAAASQVSLWISGTTYAVNQMVYSNVDGRQYKRILAGAGTTDPSSDPTNWEPLGWEYITNYPDIRPTLDLNFAGSQAVDPRITFTRNSIATYFDKFGVMQTAGVNQPRIDFDPITGECKGLLIEESRQNLALNSEVITASTGTLLVANSTIAPDDTSSADLIYESTAGGEHYAGDRSIAVTAGSVYTLSVFAKLGIGSTRRAYLRYAGAGSAGFVFDFVNEVMTDISATNMVSKSFQKLKNGWYRLTLTVQAASTTNAIFRLQLANGTASVYTGDGTSGVYFWGAQFEQGSFPTSYIPTTSSAVTRQADAALLQGTAFSQWFNAAKGSFLSLAMSLPGNSARRVFSVSDGTSSNYMQMIQSDTSGSTSSVFEIRTSGTTHSTLNPSVVHSQSLRSCSVRYGTNNFALSYNGSGVITDTTGAVPSVNRLYIGNDLGTNQLNGWIYRLSYFPKAFIGRVLRQTSSV